MEFTGTEILTLGYPEGKVIGIILKTVAKHFTAEEKDEALALLAEILEAPENYLEDEKFGLIAQELLKPKDTTIPLNEEVLEYKIYGQEGIEEGALKQINIAMKLPVAVGGALMPDAHQGYGLPIGGVLATKNSVIPYAVGVDIGCRMCMSLYDFPESILEDKRANLKKMLMNNTRFGRKTFKRKMDHEVMESDLFKEVKVIKDLKDKAYSQLGTSGGGNHFVEFGITEILDEENEFGLPLGKYLAVLSHSGSRGFGGTLANYYTKMAREICKLPQEAKHLAWLDLDTEAGQEYWMAMNLAGDYASACHQQIHERMAVGLRATPLAIIENHHNFAWKELDAEGNDIIVHRKGATPAGKGVLGVIPGSMTAPGFIVRGKGNPESINSASHGAGRLMSRTRAKNLLDKAEVAAFLQKAGVEVIGSGLDEAPMAYKDIHKVMDHQKDLIEVVAQFQPKIVRMCGENAFRESD
ncbi:MAG: RtcB family protein [Bacteroidia bacterium]|nr:RtcB family protein [Bacteroidia bacterium]